MDLSSVTPQQKMLVAAGANVIFVLCLFLDWYGTAGFGASGFDVVPSAWIFLIMALAAAALLAAEAFDVETPVRVPPFVTAFYLSSVPFWVTLAFLLEGGGGREIGLFLAFLFSAVATVVAGLLARERSR
ncbi:MAG TPA: hypothetical protein VNT51_06030 [Miltoncostaeaceae bacterium]|nr:hypothetical protein [Miltoncostaeaceae bacterium]